MADVFLSYAHADRALAERLAAELAGAGLEVWFDRELHGGAEFAKSIEREIAAARHVVVIWSKDSLESRWVRDEAQLALDTAKLVPVSIGETLPPLGFRQLQAVPLDDWARKRAALPSALLRALEADVPAPSEPSSRMRGRLPITAAIAVVLLLGAAWLVFRPGQDGAAAGDGKVLVVAPLEVAAGDGPANALKQTLTSDLTRLALGHDAQLNFVTAADGAQGQGDFSLAGSASTTGDKLAATVRLTQAKDGIILWSSDFEGPAADVPTLRQQMAVKLADVLICALGTRSRRPSDIDLPTLRLFLSGCENMHPAVAADWKVANGIFEQVVSRRPDFAQARALYAQTLNLTTGEFSGIPREEWEPIREKARAEARKALETDPALGNAYYAIASSYGYSLANFQERARAVEEGLRRDPEVADLHTSRALMLSGTGRKAEALREFERAVALDPFAPLAASNLIEAYAYAGQLERSEELLANSTANWPRSFYIDWMRLKIPARWGDARKALKFLDDAQFNYHPERADLWRLFLRARVEGGESSRQAFGNAALAAGPSLEGLARSDTIESLTQLGMIDHAYALALGQKAVNPNLNFFWFGRTMAPFRQDARFLRVMQRQGLMDFWRKNKIEPDFCSKEQLPYECGLA